jgi:plastocyanin
LSSPSTTPARRRTTSWSPRSLAVEADGGEQATTSVAEEPGTYEMVCQSHEGVGMTGTLTVVE